MNLSEAARIFRRNSLTEFSSTDNIIRGNRMEDVRQILNMVKDNSKRTENSKGGILINSLSDVEFLTPLLHPGKLILAAVNYSAHGSEGNLNIPERPYFFTKFPECMIPHNGTVIAPRISDQTDYEPLKLFFFTDWELNYLLIYSWHIWPPSTTISVPVTNDDSSEARNTKTFATSIGAPSLPRGILET